MYGLKEIHTRNMITKKIPAARKFPTPPPHNFSNGPSQKSNRFDKQNNFARFFVHFLAVIERL